MDVDMAQRHTSLSSNGEVYRGRLKYRDVQNGENPISPLYEFSSLKLAPSSFLNPFHFVL